MNENINSGFDDMMSFAKERLRGRSLKEIAKNSGASFDEKEGYLRIKSFGEELKISAEDFSCSPEISLWHHMVLLHYLDISDGVFYPDKWMPFGDMKDGLVRGTKYDKSSAAELSGILKEKNEIQIKAVFEKMGAEFLPSKADLSTRLSFLPYFPFLINIWFADDEFPLSAKMLVSKSADHCLTIEDAVTAGEVVIERIKETAQQI